MMLLEFHRDLLADTTRTEAYRSAIRSVVSRDSVVLDLGSGSGILSFFACEAGARRVFAIEESESARVVELLATHLGMADRVEVINIRSTEAQLPEPATVLVTEILGPLGLNEHILSSVIDARARLLAPGAAIIPAQLEIRLAPAQVPSAYSHHVGWWDAKQYGFDLSPLRTLAANRLYMADANPASFLAPPMTAIAVDLTAASSSIVAGTASFCITRQGTIHGFVGWFSARLAGDVSVCNDTPRATHWDQMFLPLEHPADVGTGDRVNLTLESYDGDVWNWRGEIRSDHATTPFSQSTVFGALPRYRDVLK